MNGTDNFRCVTLFGSLIAQVCTIVILLLDPRSCDKVKLEIGMYICFGVQALIFLLTLTSYICPGLATCIRYAMPVFYVSIIIGMVGV